MLDVRAEFTNALFWDLAIPRCHVTVEEDRGLVTLQGDVDRGYQRACAEADARRVHGVIGVRNEIAVRPRPPS
jgi:osmotically-inducible protein OsmY